jgi:hypothetical protein
MRLYTLAAFTGAPTRARQPHHSSTSAMTTEMRTVGDPVSVVKE